MSQAPTASKAGTTAMFYTNARIETTEGLRNILFVDDQAEKTSSLQTKMESIDMLERRLQSEYFDHVDMKIPLCSFTVTTIRLVFLKSRLTLHISHSNRPAEWCSEVDDFLFQTSVDILERTQVLISNPQYEHRAWNAIDRAWTYAETLAAGSSHNKRWTSLCRLRAKALAARTQGQSTGETQALGRNDTLQNLQTCEVTDMITAAPTSNTLAFDELEPYGSMSAYWNLLDEGWGMVSEGTL
ncbi:hypothetical protein PRZ48_006733 [Zasmidium cellare]|uniref:Uncharacterized protein n=1 Tax=Zasmidium cellare TaxID=395010 RepID=A0ABR0EPX5_ZASCE|nr:hypothetical protein PRZ48_006733 [Zasmidium cellare]